MDSQTTGDNSRTDDAQADRLRGAEESPKLSRRKFTRAALTGSAVVFSVGNKGAWGQVQEICISTSVLTSYYTTNPSAVARHETEVQNFLDGAGGDAYDKPNSVPPQTCYNPDA
jgi:hypothetical protein